MSALRCIHREDSAFGVYYQRLVQRGLKKGSALMAVMRKMLAVSVGSVCRTLQDVALKCKEVIFFS
jgi:hypothetical protein